MRSSGGTKSLPALSVAAWTNARMRALAGPSFHEGSGWAQAMLAANRNHARQTLVNATFFIRLASLLTASASRLRPRKFPFVVHDLSARAAKAKRASWRPLPEELDPSGASSA